MYAKYGWQRDAVGKRIRLENGQYVEDKKKMIGYHLFEKQLNLVVDYESGLYNIVPVIRDDQFEMARVTRFGLGATWINLQKLPELHKSKSISKGKKGAKDPSMPEDLIGMYRPFVKIVTPGSPPPPLPRFAAKWTTQI